MPGVNFMDKKCEDFLNKCRDIHISVSAFITLFNIWSALSSEQRGDIIDSEIKKGRLWVK